MPQALSVEVSAQLYSGPLPHPSILREYDKIAKGSAARIITQFEEQGRHRRDMEKMAARQEFSRSWGGLIGACTVALAVLGLSGYMASLGQSTAGATVATADLASIVGVFIYGTRERRREREKKAKLMFSSGNAQATAKAETPEPQGGDLTPAPVQQV